MVPIDAKLCKLAAVTGFSDLSRIFQHRDICHGGGPFVCVERNQMKGNPTAIFFLFAGLESAHLQGRTSFQEQVNSPSHTLSFSQTPTAVAAG